MERKSVTVERICALVGDGENVVLAISKLGLPVMDTLMWLPDFEGELMAAHKKSEKNKRMIVS